MFLGCEGILGKLVLLGRLWVQEYAGGAVLTMVEQGYDPSVALERGQAQG